MKKTNHPTEYRKAISVMPTKTNVVSVVQDLAWLPRPIDPETIETCPEAQKHAAKSLELAQSLREEIQALLDPMLDELREDSESFLKVQKGVSRLTQTIEELLIELDLDE